ncbi:MAG: UDP-glucose 4-epimerase GalE [Micrococcales bacterium]|nr:UDP-glucose 4-epimerase GalE [Micrococcales bacterium]
MKILVTGGAGYIGSHIVRALQASGHQSIIVDDLSFGLKSRIGETKLIELDLASPEATTELVEIFQDHEIDGVIHLAARKSVAESVARPDYYQEQNVGSVINLLSAMKQAEVTRMVFSSSAAVYGSPEVPSVDEDYPCEPINPYGQTKLMGEELILNATKDWGLRAVALRYFNVAGAGFDDLGDSSVANLIPIALNAVRENKPVQVFGSDWPTVDGSCVRDYIHVADLADAHIASLDYLDSDSRNHYVFNVGTGSGSSVLQVIQTLSEVMNQEVLFELTDRRPGDPAALSAKVDRINQELGWRSKYDLKEIIASAHRASLN